jgi:ABC-type nitrate/sulfonate/bicarbonate transport system ATPase subunit
MPAKGADLIETEAPEQEPRAFQAPKAPGVPLSLREVSKSFAGRRGTVRALAGVTLACEPGEVLGIVGPSGCGKTTLLELVCGLEPADAGEISVAAATGQRERLELCALMPQRDLLMPWRSALDNATLPLELAGTSRAQARRQVEPLFRRLGLDGFASARPRELSGGMRQRVAFLRTLLAGKPVLLLDEPFAALDTITRADMQEWLGRALEDQPRTVVLVTHDVEEALYLSDRVAVMSSRPGTVRVELPGARGDRSRPRRETVTSPSFTSLREKALEALA